MLATPPTALRSLEQDHGVCGALLAVFSLPARLLAHYMTRALLGIMQVL
jgi:hypothetical protein